MNIEKKLKKYILEKHSSMLNFTKNAGLSHSWCDNLIKNGLQKTQFSNIYKACKKLDISIDLLLVGQIGKLSLTQIDLRDDEKIILQNYNILNELGQIEAKKHIFLLLESKKYQKIFTRQPNLANNI
ncbi:MAG: hypothetical protein LBF33_00125 [Oscillospiraceae bacterium]|jgi:DNA-binding Xre family transcriptional regulator|nr:hypothetical protein [Oscillospiraceae bacterium]